jgi:hypothetical protein
MPLSFCYFFLRVWKYFPRHLKSDTLYLLSPDKLRNDVLHVAHSIKNCSFMLLYFSLSSFRLDCEKVKLFEA